MFREGMPGRTDVMNRDEREHLERMQELEAEGRAVIMFHEVKGFRYITDEMHDGNLDNAIAAAEKRGYTRTEKQTQTVEVPVVAPGNPEAAAALAASGKPKKRAGRYSNTGKKKMAGNSKRAAERAKAMEAEVDARAGGGE